jgi:hypothetical protein
VAISPVSSASSIFESSRISGTVEREMSETNACRSSPSPGSVSPFLKFPVASSSSFKPRASVSRKRVSSSFKVSLTRASARFSSG